MLLPFQGANPNIHNPRALPWAGCLLAFASRWSATFGSGRYFSKTLLDSNNILYNVLEDVTTHSRILSTWTRTSKISRVKNLVPRSGILSTTAGNKNTRPWYKKYHCWHFNHKPSRKGRKRFLTQQPLYHFKKRIFHYNVRGRVSGVIGE